MTPTLGSRIRLFARTRVTDRGCLVWLGCVKHPSKRDHRGGQSLPHGQVKWNGRKVGAHRVAFALHAGVPEASVGLIAHTCDNPRCVNPAHLQESTYGANLRDAWDRGRRRATVWDGPSRVQAHNPRNHPTEGA